MLPGLNAASGPTLPGVNGGTTDTANIINSGNTAAQGPNLNLNDSNSEKLTFSESVIDWLYDTVCYRRCRKIYKRTYMKLTYSPEMIQLRRDSMHQRRKLKRRNQRLYDAV